MPRPTISEQVISQVSLPLKAQNRNLESEAFPFRHGFCKALLARLEDLGVDPIDLQVRDVPIWTSGRRPPCGPLKWMRRDELKEDRLIEVMGQMNDPDSCLYNLHYGQDTNNRGEQRAIELIARARSLEEVLGAWSVAALVPVVISTRTDVEGLKSRSKWMAEKFDHLEDPYAHRRESNYSEYEALEIAEDLIGPDFHARQMWNGFSTTALPNFSVLLHRAATDLDQASYDRGGLLDYIAGAIASTLATHRPVNIHWHDEAPIDAVRLPVEAASARLIADRKENRAEWLRQQEAIKTETPLESRHRILPEYARHQVQPGARNFAMASDKELGEVEGRLLSIEAIAVWYGVSSAKMSARLKKMRMNAEAKQVAQTISAAAVIEAASVRASSYRNAQGSGFTSLSHSEVLSIARSMPRAQLLSAYGLTPAKAGRRIEEAVPWEKKHRPAR